MELEISPRVSIFLLSDGSKSVSSTCAMSWNKFISTCWGCQNFSGEMAALILLLWRKCHVLLCICPPGVSSLSLATGHFLQLYCCLQSLLFIIGIPTVFSYTMVTAPGIPDYASLLPSHTSYFSPCIRWLLWLWHEFLVSTQEQALLFSVSSWIKCKQVTNHVTMVPLHY